MTFWQHVASGVLTIQILSSSAGISFSPSPPALGHGKPYNRNTDSKHQHISLQQNLRSKFEVPKKEKGTNLEFLFIFVPSNHWTPTTPNVAAFLPLPPYCSALHERRRRLGTPKGGAFSHAADVQEPHQRCSVPHHHVGDLLKNSLNLNN